MYVFRLIPPFSALRLVTDQVTRPLTSKATGNLSLFGTRRGGANLLQSGSPPSQYTRGLPLPGLLLPVASERQQRSA